jgi:SpoIID/LytB domain protein
VAALAILLAVAPALAEDPSPSPSPSPSPGLAGPITFYGRGWGHGVGMSQYGARGRALEGQDAATILAHYYPGTTMSAVDPASVVRVLIAAAHRPTASSPVRVTGRRGAWTIDGVGRKFPVGASANLARRPTTHGTFAWRLRVRKADGTLLYSARAPKIVRIRPAAGTASRFQVGFKPASSDTYRGVLRLLPRPNGTVLAINELELDLYLRGVVPVEMPSNWPAEALNAQAVAARSYAVRHLRPGVGTFDLFDDARSQVYRGLRAERVPTNAAVSATAGQVVMSGAVVASTVFHSAAGGATEDNENVWTSSTGVPGTPVAYLRGAPDRAPDGTAYDAASPYAAWATASYSIEVLSAIFAADPRTNVGAITGLDLSHRGVSGRLISVGITGAAGTAVVSGEVFRSIFNKYSPLTDPALRSTLFDLAPLP